MWELRPTLGSCFSYRTVEDLYFWLWPWRSSRRVNRNTHSILIFILILIYLLTAIGLTPGGSSTVHIYTQTLHRTTQLTALIGKLSGIRTQSAQTKISDKLIGKSAPSLRVIPWHLPYNWGKSTEKPLSE